MSALLDGFRRQGFAFALRMLGNSDEAADAVHDGLLALVRNRKTIRNGHDPAAWFFRVLRNGCIDRIRRRTARAAQPLSDHVDRGSWDPSIGAQRDEFVERLRLELGRLDQDQREIVLLRDFHGMSYAQIAEILSIAEGTVMSRLHRARMALRERMRDLM